MVLNTMHRMVYPFLPVFVRGLGVDLQTLSLALTARAITGSFGPFLASVSDSRGRKSGMLFGLVLFIAGLLLVVLWPVYTSFLLALMLTTLGNFTFIPSMQAYLGDRVPYQRRGLAMAVTEVGWSLSFIAIVPLLGLLIASRGWMSPFPLLALMAMVSLLALGWLLPSDPAPDGARPGLWRNFRTVFTSPPALAGLVMGIMTNIANESINLVFGVWIEDAFNLKIAALGLASIVIGVSELGGEALVGGLTDRLGKVRSVGLGLILNGVAALLLPFLGKNLAGAFSGLFLFYITFEFTIVSILPLMSEVLPTARATLMATNIAGFSAGRALGASLAAQVFAWGILGNALVCMVFNLLALLALQVLKRTRRDGLL